MLMEEEMGNGNYFRDVNEDIIACILCVTPLLLRVLFRNVHTSEPLRLQYLTITFPLSLCLKESSWPICGNYSVYICVLFFPLLSLMLFLSLFL